MLHSELCNSAYECNQSSQGELQLSDTRTKTAMTSCVLSFRGCSWDLLLLGRGLFCQSSHPCDQSQPGSYALWGPELLALEPVIPSRRQLDLRKGSSISNLESTSIKFLLIWNSILGRNIIISCVLIGRKLLALGSSGRGLLLPSPLPGLHSHSAPHSTFDGAEGRDEFREQWKNNFPLHRKEPDDGYYFQRLLCP